VKGRESGIGSGAFKGAVGRLIKGRERRVIAGIVEHYISLIQLK
jgi:hypothetical protein